MNLKSLRLSPILGAILWASSPSTSHGVEPVVLPKSWCSSQKISYFQWQPNCASGLAPWFYRREQ